MTVLLPVIVHGIIIMEGTIEIERYVVCGSIQEYFQCLKENKIPFQDRVNFIYVSSCGTLQGLTIHDDQVIWYGSYENRKDISSIRKELCHNMLRRYFNGRIR